MEDEASVVVVDSRSSSELFYQISCTACRVSHRKCDRRLPACASCVKRNLQCNYQPPKKRQRQSPTSSSPVPSATSATSSVTISQYQPPAKQARITPPSSSTTPSYTPSSSNTQIETVVSSSTPSASKSPIFEILDVSFLKYCEKVSPRVSSNPQASSSDLFEFKANKALWFATKALLLQHIPSKHDVGVSEMDIPQLTSVFMSKMRATMMNLGDGSVADISDLTHLVDRFSRADLRQGADEMYRRAKETILDPDIYPHIATNGKLALACSTMGIFVSGKSNTIIGEGKLFLSVVKVFLEAVESVANVDVNLFSGAERTRIEKLQLNVRMIIQTYYAARMLMVLNELPSKSGNYANIQQLEKACDFAAQSFEAEKQIAERIASPVQSFYRLKRILNEERGLDRLMKFVEVCKLMQDDIGWMHDSIDHKPSAIVNWRLTLLAFSLFAIVSEELVRGYEQVAYSNIKAMKLEYANKITQFMMENFQYALLLGSFLARILRIVSDVHMEHTGMLLADPHVTIDTLSAFFAQLQANVYVVEGVYDKYGIQDLDDISKRLKSQISSVSAKLQLLQQRPSPQQQSVQQQSQQQGAPHRYMFDSFSAMPRPSPIQLQLFGTDYPRLNTFNPIRTPSLPSTGPRQPQQQEMPRTPNFPSYHLPNTPMYKASPNHTNFENGTPQFSDISGLLTENNGSSSTDDVLQRILEETSPDNFLL